MYIGAIIEFREKKIDRMHILKRVYDNRLLGT